MNALPHGRPVIIGGGLAGMMTALSLSEPCILMSAGPIGDHSSSRLAQGGVAAALGPGDNAAAHLADTLAAGDGLCDARASAAILAGAGEAIARLRELGVQFDTGADGNFVLGLEAAHGARRIVHAHGDGTGAEIVRALVQAVRSADHIMLLEGFRATRLHVADGAIAGVLAEGPQGRARLQTGRVVLATGGIGALYTATTNPAGSTGQGLALAARAGAQIVDPEFVQFHPTALDCGAFPTPLISEAVRGDGAILVDERGERFMLGIAGMELAPRDVVARAIHEHIAAGHRVFLDARQAIGARFPDRFPGITALCNAAGIDPVTAPIPVRPAAHYHMGGVGVDGDGRSSVAGLWAVGEVAATGLHGANRLASNSLLEAAVMGPRVAANVAVAPALLVAADTGPEPEAARDGSLEAVRAILGRDVAISRDEAGLCRALAALRPLAQHSDAALVGLMIAVGAFERRESRGAHCRADFPGKVTAARTCLTMAEALAIADAAVPKLSLSA